MRRRTLFAALAGLAVVIAVGTVVLWPRLEPPSRITQENCDQIREEMHQAEVEAILGPPGDYTTAGPSNTFFDTYGLLSPIKVAASVAIGSAIERSLTLSLTNMAGADDGIIVRLVRCPKPDGKTLSGVPSASGTAGSRSRPCGGGNCSWRWRREERPLEG
jgi:hypothetical protein